MYYKSVSAIAGGGKTAVLLNTFSKGLARCSGSNWVFFPDPNWLCAPGANTVLEVNRNDISSELRKYVNNDIQLSAIIEYMGYDEGVLHEHEGNVFFVNESNWLIARLVNHMTGEIVQDDIILDSGSITDVLNSRDAFFDYIFGTENH